MPAFVFPVVPLSLLLSGADFIAPRPCSILSTEAAETYPPIGGPQRPHRGMAREPENLCTSGYSPLTLTIVHAQERNAPRGCEPIDWKLITDLPVHSNEEAIEKLRYALRWRIEVLHNILNSGCKAEDAKLRTAERLANLIAIFCIMSWRIFWMTMINRSAADAPPKTALTRLEMEILDRLVKDNSGRHSQQKTPSHYLIKIARLGGYLARANDPPPGNTVMWRGLARLTDIDLGFALATE